MKLLALFCCATLAAIGRAGPDLGPGSPAPKLEVREWIQGEPVRELEPDQTYVVEFWATWCGPCIEGIPHLTELARQYKQVRFLGISILEDNDKRQVQNFVSKMGDKMGYTVGYSGNKDGMAKSWMSAARQPGIPTAFIIKNATVMWIGHPMVLGTPLGQIVRNEFDLDAARKSFQARLAAREADEKLRARIEECSGLYDAGNTQTAKEALAAVEQDPKGKAAAEPLRFRWLCLEEPEAWRATATQRMEKATDHGDSLCIFADENALRSPAQCRWLIQQLTTRFPDNWYPWLCGARVFLKLKEHDAALGYTQKARDAILQFRREHPESANGNALDVIKALEDQIKSDKGS